MTRSMTFFSVGNGNCCLLDVDGFLLAIDLHATEDNTSFELLKPFFRSEDGVDQLDALCITHGDRDHCGGFSEFREKIDSGALVVGSIWHPNYDRAKIEGVDGLPEDYLDLHAEIMRRRESGSDSYGLIEVPLRAWDGESEAFRGLNQPNGVELKTLSPYVEDEGDTEWDVNDISLVINLTVSGLSILYPGDSGAAIWQERIFPKTLDTAERQDWAEADLFLASHHGSFSFLGRSREDVLDADPYPENYPALEAIAPEELIVSAISRFPTSADESGDDPPHFAAWKWYHKWFRENRGVKEDEQHPECFRYTADGHLRLELGDSGWEWVDDWAPPDNGGGQGKEALGFAYRGGRTRRSGGHYARNSGTDS